MNRHSTLVAMDALEAMFDGPIPGEFTDDPAARIAGNLREYERLIRHQIEALRRLRYLAGERPHAEMRAHRMRAEADLRLYLAGRRQLRRALKAPRRVSLWDEVA